MSPGWWTFLSWVFALLASAGTAHGDVTDAVAKGARHLAAFELDEATVIAEATWRFASHDPEARWLLAEVRLWQGRYEDAIALLVGVPNDTAQGAVGETRRLVEGALNTTRGFEVVTSPKGYFTIAYAPGSGEVLVELAADALDATYDRLANELGFRYPTPVRVDIVEHASDLAKVSPLSIQDITTTQTIAFAKYNRVVIVSPRATLVGYPWLDTLAHEFSHLVIGKVSRGAAPVWLHEGIARWMQGRWRGEQRLALTRAETALLVRAARRGTLLAFSDMQPSFARLPSQEAAALAYAQVATFVESLAESEEPTFIARLLTALPRAKSAQRAISELTGQSFANVERRWQASLRERKATDAAPLWGRLKKGGVPNGQALEGTIANPGVRKHVRLGGVLRAQGHTAAAAIEYERALTAGYDDIAARKLARVRVELGDSDGAIALAQPLLAADIYDVQAAVTLGLAYASRAEWRDAAGAFEAAARMNPFDPLVRCGWADALGKVGANTPAVSREQKACAQLTGKVP